MDDILDEIDQMKILIAHYRCALLLCDDNTVWYDIILPWDKLFEAHCYTISKKVKYFWCDSHNKLPLSHSYANDVHFYVDNEEIAIELKLKFQ